VGIELRFPDFLPCNLISLPTEPSTHWVFSVSAVLYCTIAAGPRSLCARPNCFVCLDSICSCNALAYVYKTNCYQNVLFCLVFCLQCSEVHSPQCRTAVQRVTAWRMQTLRIPTFWEVALCRRVTVPVVWKASSSPVTALDIFETSGSTHLGYSATYPRTWILRNTVVRTTKYPDICSSSQKLSRILWSFGVHYRIQNSPPDFPLLSQLTPVQDLSFYLMYLLSCYLRLCLPSGLFPQIFPPNTTLISPLAHTWQYQSWSSSFCTFLQFPATTFLQSHISPLAHYFRAPSACVSPFMKRPSSTPISNNRKNFSSVYFKRQIILDSISWILPFPR